VRMDGAWLGSVDISINKAFTSRAFDIATKDLQSTRNPAGSSSASTLEPRQIMIFAGGIPLKREGSGGAIA